MLKNKQLLVAIKFCLKPLLAIIVIALCKLKAT